MSMDAVDLTIVGTVMMCFGFAVGIIISANSPTKAEKEQELEDYGYGKPKDKSDEILDDLFAKEAAFIIDKFMPLVDSEEATDIGFCFCREKKVANAKSCALHAVELVENSLTRYGKNNDELQNMDSEWRYIDNLKKAIEQYK